MQPRPQRSKARRLETAERGRLKKVKSSQASKRPRLLRISLAIPFRRKYPASPRLTRQQAFEGFADAAGDAVDFGSEFDGGLKAGDAQAAG
jgi:hypothetical protein